MFAFIIQQFRDLWYRLDGINLSSGLGIDITFLHLVVSLFVVGTLVNLITGSDDDL